MGDNSLFEMNSGCHQWTKEFSYKDFYTEQYGDEFSQRLWVTCDLTSNALQSKIDLKFYATWCASLKSTPLLLTAIMSKKDGIHTWTTDCSSAHTLAKPSSPTKSPSAWRSGENSASAFSQWSLQQDTHPSRAYLPCDNSTFLTSKHTMTSMETSQRQQRQSQ